MRRRGRSLVIVDLIGTCSKVGRKLRAGTRWLLRSLASADWRRETIYPLTAAMEIAWFTPWYMALIPATGRLPAGRTAIGLFIVMVIPVYTTRLLSPLNLRPRVQSGVLAVFLLLTCLLAVRVFLYAGQAYQGLGWLATTIRDVLNVYEIIPDWLIIVLSTLYLWWRGIILGQRRPSVQAVALGFYVGIVSFISFVLLVNLVTDEDPSFFIPAFFFYSIMALAATRMEQMRGLRGAIRSPFGFSWLLAMALAAFVVVLLGALLGALLTGSNMHKVLQWTAPLLLLFGIVLGLLMSALRAVADMVIGFMGTLGLDGTAKPLTDVMEGLGELISGAPGAGVETPPALGATVGVLRLAVIVGLVVGLGALAIWVIRRPNAPERAGEGEDHESVFSSAVLLENLRQMVDRGRWRLVSVLGLVERSGLRGLFAALTIRRIYAQMLRVAAERGYARAASQTPYEYEGTAARAFPGAIAEVHSITEAYVAVHYGEVPETDAELQEIRTCWETLKGSLRKTDARMR